MIYLLASTLVHFKKKGEIFNFFKFLMFKSVRDLFLLLTFPFISVILLFHLFNFLLTLIKFLICKLYKYKCGQRKWNPFALCALINLTSLKCYFESITSISKWFWWHKNTCTYHTDILYYLQENNVLMQSIKFIYLLN